MNTLNTNESYQTKHSLLYFSDANLKAYRSLDNKPCKQVY